VVVDTAWNHGGRPASLAAGCHVANNLTGTTVFLSLALLVLVLRLILIAFR
jgi:hypothetical protein